MNERIKQLLGQAYDQAVPETWTTLSSEQLGKVYDKFAKLIVQECVDIANDTRYDGKVVANRIKFVFGVEEHRGWVCSKCGTDRTREACPLGHMAAVTGECPMTAEAQ